jgi:hypothetical protein
VDPREQDLSSHGTPLRGSRSDDRARSMIQKIFLSDCEEVEALVEGSEGIVLVIPQRVDLTSFEETDREEVPHHFQTVLRGDRSG